MTNGDILKRKSPTGNGQRCIVIDAPKADDRVYIGYISSKGKWETEVHSVNYFEETGEHYDIDKVDREIRILLEGGQDKSKTGHWIDTGSGQECSECHEIQYGYDSFRFYCAKCGSKNMEVSE